MGCHFGQSAPVWIDSPAAIPEHPLSGDVETDVCDSRDRIAPGSGATMRSGAAKIAVYGDENGAYHECSAICPHLGCVVCWNGSEKTWDCPCHGSRFDPRGNVVNGPADRNLARGDGQPPFIPAAGAGLRTAALQSANVPESC